ncbi:MULTISPECIES: super-infection exclusion protein B [unclassified Cronobacter]|uniref:super-infection exclusion protein B n=1 Tax=unclassified Cronobacter TaxID=2649764 RepID=UPI00210838AC|nr:MULTISPECIES: super-infection exclusion protein B [unclassified Cronobacter]
MIVIVLFFLIMIFAPENLPEFISGKSGVPYAFHIFSFAVAYVVVLFSRVVGLFFMAFCYHKVRTKRMLKKLNSLSSAQLLLLDDILYSGASRLCVPGDNADANALIKAGIIRPTGFNIDRTSVMLNVDPEYKSLMLATWNPFSKRFDILP